MKLPIDRQYQEHKIESVDGSKEKGWSIGMDSGWHFFVPASSPIEPKIGMTARLYGKGTGYAVRGLMLDDVEVFYRTEAQEHEYRETERFGADAADWLARWDEGKTVWSVEMGGLGPGYEQAIQITVAEILRHLLEKRYNAAAWATDEKARDRDMEAIRDAGFANETIKAMGLSGAQWGAALNVATNLYRRGPIEALGDERVKDRLIQVSKRFPVAA